jgi:uncharacterized membrane protein
MVVSSATAPLAAQDPAPGPAPGARVRAVLFYSPTCPHCRDVITDHLPPIQATFGDRLRIVGVNTYTEQGQAIYLAMARAFYLPRERLGVPTLVVGSTVLVGSGEIPAELPGIVERGLRAGGIDWPDLPELRAWLAAQGETVGGGVDAADGQHGAGGWVGTFRRDPLANSLAVAVLLATVLALAGSLGAVAGRWRAPPSPPGWLVPALALAGAGVAAYLTRGEVGGSAVVCGPVGDCAAVQQSRYAHLFGVVPVGALGLGGYLAMAGAWILAVTATGVARLARGLLWGLALVATAFSAYLTFLEPFVIGATCAWCLASALIAGALLLATTRGVASSTGGRSARATG